MLTEDIEERLLVTLVAARKLRHKIATVEHILFAIHDNPAVVKLLKDNLVCTDKLRQHLGTYIAKHTPIVEGTGWMEVEHSPGFVHVIQLASMYMEFIGAENQEIDGLHLLWAILGERNSYASRYLRARQISIREVGTLIQNSCY